MNLKIDGRVAILDRRKSSIYFVCLFYSIVYLNFIRHTSAVDDLSGEQFCGELKVFQQKWFSKNAITLSARRTENLSECIRQCCAISKCNAITYVGFLSIHESTPANNCFWFKCAATDENDLQCGDRSVSNLSHSADSTSNSAREGVLSILIWNRLNKQLEIEPTILPSTQFEITSTPSKAEDENTHLFPQFSSDNNTDSTTSTYKTTTTFDDAILPKFTVIKVNSGKNKKENSVNEKISQLETNQTSPKKNQTLISHDVSNSPTGGQELISTPNDEDVPSNAVEFLPTARNNEDSTKIGEFSENKVIKDIDFKNKSTALGSTQTTLVWVFGLAIVAGVFFGGLILTCVGGYLCYKRRRTRMRSTQFKATATTLHAFSPPHTAVQAAGGSRGNAS